MKGHQDDHNSISDIDIWGQLNIAADKYAKNLLHRSIEQGDLPFHVRPTATLVGPIRYNPQGKERLIVSKLSSSLQTEIAKDSALSFWHAHGRPVYHPYADLQVLETATTKTPLWQR